jgi:methionyl-tRNA synthetase
LAESFDGLVEDVSSRLDRVDVSGALDEIWQRVRELNAFVTTREPWNLAKDPDKAPELDGVLYALVEGLRVVSLLLHPWIPDATDKLLTALGEEGRGLSSFGDWEGGHVRKIDQLFPRVEV